LPEWQKIGRVTVITSHVDKETHRVAETNRARLAITDSWYLNGASCNKGAAMNDVIHRSVNPGEIIAVFDADCYPVGDFSVLYVPPGMMCGCQRIACRTPEEFTENRGKSYDELAPMVTPAYVDRPHLIRGYFQLFQYEPKLRFGGDRHRTFSGC